MTLAVEQGLLSLDVAEVMRSAQSTRKTTSQRRLTESLVKDYRGLPDYQIKERWEVIEILRRVKKDIGLTDDLINHIEYIMKRIPVAEWEPGGCPVFYQSVINQAKDLQLTDRAIRYRENKLADLGFLAFYDSSNGRRYPIKINNHVVKAFGVSLVPLMMRVDELRREDYEYKQNLLHWKHCRQEIAAIRRRITNFIADCCENFEDLDEFIIEWSSRWKAVRPVRSSDSLKSLVGRLEVLRELEDEILSVIAACEGSGKTCEQEEAEAGKTCGLTQNISATPETDFRHIDTNTESDISKGYYSNPPEHSSGDNIEQCSPKGSQEGGLDVSKAHTAPVNASQGEACAQNRESKGKEWRPASDYGEYEHLSGAEYLTPAHIYEASCSDFRQAVDRVTNGAKADELSVNDIKLAAEYLQPFLNVSPYTWKNANQTIGRYGAAIGLMLACRPNVRIAGAYLNELISRQKKGELHLHKSVFGKLYRAKKERVQ
ncbi:hypothetical protein MTBPR1_80136 [Candidatus Terasakiella magnetica]|uniref:Uncharacterized protein n=1 Tax=Candidatus Terasakiella magnetica TaxID=1867952 RepID=A0A1C3RL94_9PROT|nr:replication initiation protein RepC [Candidatus Terasakiella magnetica]SCA58082.1 hypothetical protein MTBPR1_80136 [Candidatus Terasakiella magnetica]